MQDALTTKFRITSYNVCYTKLLRFDALALSRYLGGGMGGGGGGGDLAGNPRSDFPDTAEWFRITSYNVCYTKLLRNICEIIGCAISVIPTKSSR